MVHQYTTTGTCSKAIAIDYDPETMTINEVQFLGGCHGNTQGVAALCKGNSIKSVAQALRGIDCRGKGTSCPDQLATALEEILTKN